MAGLNGKLQAQEQIINDQCDLSVPVYPPGSQANPDLIHCCKAICRANRGALATTYCCGGTPTVCLHRGYLVPNYVKPSQATPTGISIILYCAQRHEQEHISQISCTHCSGNPQSIRCAPIAIDPQMTMQQAECDAYCKELGCLLGHIAACATAPDHEKYGCIASVSARIASVRSSALHFCGGPCQ